MTAAQPDAKRGRPTKLNEARAAQIVNMVRGGSFALVAARANGIHQATYHAWMARGRDAERDDDGHCVNPDDQLYADFHDSVKDAEAAAEVQSIALIRQSANNGTWQAAAWYLERKYPDRWGRKDHVRQEVSGVGGGPVHVDAKAELLGILASRRDPDLDPLTGEQEDATEVHPDDGSPKPAEVND